MLCTCTSIKRAVFKAAGDSFSSTNAEAVAMTYCDDDLNFLTQVLGSLPVINRANFMEAVNHLGGAFPAAQVPEMFFSPDRHYGVKEGWDMRYVTSRQCVRYVGASFPSPKALAQYP